MLLDRTIAQLDIGPVPPEQARAMGHMGYAQWLGSLQGDLGYPTEARAACEKARPFAARSPAVEAFCALLAQSAAAPLTPLSLTLPRPKRRGGAKARRNAL